MLNEYREFIELLAPVLIDDPCQKDVERFLTVINSDDAPILASEVGSGADFLITWDRAFYRQKYPYPLKPENRHSRGIFKVFQGIHRIIPVAVIRDIEWIGCGEWGKIA